MWSLLLLLAPLGVLCDVTVPVSNHWGGGFQAQACFDITEEMHAWKMHLIFDQAINSVDVWAGTVESTSADKTEYVIRNAQHNGVQHTGSHMCIDFQGHATGDVVPTIHASIEGVTGSGATVQATDRPTVQTLPAGQTYPPSTTHLPGARLEIRGTDFYKDGQKVFLSGANTAWVSYGYDFGNGQYQQRRAQYIHRLDMVKNAGGNSMRTWVHVHGATSPKFDSTGMVTGLDNGGTFIEEFRQYLDDAFARDILIFPCLWNGAVVQEREKLHGLMTEPAKLQSYLDNALTPWVTALKDHPALGGWDIINEWEGFIRTGVADPEPCYDSTHLTNSGCGWAGQLYTPKEILRFLNWQADAIYKADPHALVTAGSCCQLTNTDNFGKFNYYKDTCLVKGGGKANGMLNFYSTHSYAWQGNFPTESAFKNDPADLGLDKPIVIAEFQEKDNSGGGMTDVQMFQYIYSHGYQGAWVWSDDTEAAQAAGIKAINGQTGAAGLVNFPL